MSGDVGFREAFGREAFGRERLDVPDPWQVSCPVELEVRYRDAKHDEVSFIFQGRKRGGALRHDDGKWRLIGKREPYDTAEQACRGFVAIRMRGVG